MDKIRFICATRRTRSDFLRNAPLGRSLFLFRNEPLLELRLFEQNRAGLPSVYNVAIEEAKADPAILVFIHDDVHLCDLHWPTHIFSALKTFGIVGVAGNKRRLPRQPSWAFVDTTLTWDAAENLSGVVAHGKGYPCEVIDVFGPACQEVKLLDGVMLVVHSQVLHDKGLRFDKRFTFHFYDVDFCRQAEAKGVTMGTWTISIIHESSGVFGSEQWQAEYRKYLEKWEPA